MQLQEFRQDLDARMSAAKISGFWKQPDKDRWINKGIVRACNYARWKFLSKHASQLVEKNPDGTLKENYFLPFDFKPGGLITINVGGTPHHKVSEDEYTQQSYSYERVVAIIGDEYHLNLSELTGIAEGTIIDIYYKRRPVRMVEDDDEPITPEEMDEPIVKLALSVCLTKTPGKQADAQKEVVEAHTILQQIKDREDEEPTSVYKGQAGSSRWE